MPNVTKKNNEYEAVKSEVLALKLELEEAVKSRESGEKGMDNIQTHREYEALEKQIAELRKTTGTTGAVPV